MPKFNSNDLFRIASLYYNEGLSQQEISVKENISRPQISRMLAQAREDGIVKISLIDPNSLECNRIEKEFTEVTGLKRVYIVSPNSNSPYDGNSSEMSIEAFSNVAAPVVLKLIERSVLIGVGWGRTTFGIAQAMNYSSTTQGDRLVFPLCGSASGVTDPEYQNSAVSMMLATKLHCKNFFLNSSSIPPKKELLSADELESITKLENYWNSLDTAIFSVGLGRYDAGVVPATSGDGELAGDILLQTYYTDGSVCDVTAGNLIAIDLEKLKTIPNSILIAIGKEKVNAICYAIRLGFCNTLVTDIYTARKIVKNYNRI